MPTKPDKLKIFTPLKLIAVLKRSDKRDRVHYTSQGYRH